MPSIVSKVKDAIRGDSGDSPEDSRTGKLDMTDSERAKQYGTSGHGASDKYGTSSQGMTGGQGTTGDQARFMGAGQMNPTSATSDSRGSSNLPGSFPGSEREAVASHHKDGREYAAPTGSQVGQGSSGRDTSGNYDYGQTPTSRRRVEDERNVMDPSSHGSGSNVMGGAAGASAGAGAAAYEPGSGHSKLHKRDDPRAYAGAEDPSSHHSSKHHGTHGTQGTQSTHRETIGGDPYERQAAQGYSGDPSSKSHGHRGAEAAAATAGTAGVGGLATQQIPSRHHGDTERQAYMGSSVPSRQDDMSGAGSHQARDYADTSRGVGTYNTVTGAGSREDPSSMGRSTGQTYDSTPGMTSGSGAMPREAGDSRIGAGTTALGAGAAGAGVGGLASHHHSKGREQDYGRGTEPGYGTSSTQRDHTSSSYGTSGQPTTASSQPGGVSSAGASGHYGPGHTGSKVMVSTSNESVTCPISHPAPIPPRRSDSSFLTSSSIHAPNAARIMTSATISRGTVSIESASETALTAQTLDSLHLEEG